MILGHKKRVTISDYSFLVAVPGSLKSVNYVNDSSYLVSLHHKSAVVSKNSNTTITEGRSYTSLVSKDNENYYISTSKGLLVHHKPTNKNTALFFKDRPIFVFDLTETTNGIVWCATYNLGVLGIENNTIKYHLETKDGLASNTINKIEADGNNLWIASEAGLQFYNSSTKNYQTLSKLNGLNSYNINQIEILKNDVFFSSNTGLFSLNKADVFPDKKVPSVYFTSVIVNDETREISSKYVLNQTESEIDVAFHSNGFQSGKTVEYYYKLEGFDSHWTLLKGEAQNVKYNSLPEGEFILKVKAKTIFSKSFSDEEHLAITVFLPFYKTWWFISLISALVIALVVLYYSLKIYLKELEKNKEFKQLEIDKQMVSLKLENLRSQMNPHFIFNALNSIQEYIVLNQQNLASTYLVKFSRLIRMYLEQSQEQKVTLEREIDALKLYLELEKVRFEEELTYHLNIAEDLQLTTIKIPSLFIQPYIENAIKHGLHHKISNRVLMVNFYKEAQELVCEIKDNGIGREEALKLKAKQSQYYKSFATSANAKRVDLINKDRTNKVQVNITDLKNDNQQSSGTKVTITFPI